MPFKTIKNLGKEMLWKFLQSRETKLDIPAIIWYMGCTKNVIPQTQRYSEIYAVFPVFRHFISMMPDVHGGIVKNVFEWSKVKIELGMIEMPNAKTYDMHYEKIINTKTNHC